MSDRQFMSAAAIHARINWRDTLCRLGVDKASLNGKHGPCPGCGGKDRFRFDDKFDRGNFICSQLEPKQGDGFQLVQHIRGCDFATARAIVMNAVGLTDDIIEPPPPASTPTVQVQRSTLSDFGHEIWHQCAEIDGDAALYLKARRCRLPPRDSDLRWHPNLRHPSGYIGPALIGLVTDALTNAAISLHRTWVRPDGTKPDIQPARMLLKGHRKAGGVIRLWPNEGVTSGLSIAEGIETCLVAAHGVEPIWSVIDAGNMAAFRILLGIDSLTIFADNDEAGRKAANACAQRWASVAAVMIVCPDEPGFDIADAVAK